MKRLFSLLLFVALCMSAFPAAVLAIERDDYENIASKDYTEDETVFFTSYESLSLSSGSPDRWNAMYPRTQVGPIDNPTDPTDKVGCFLSPGSTATKKFLYAEEGKPFAFSTDMYIPTCTDGESYPLSLSLKLSKTVILTLTYDAQSGLYTWAFGSKSGTVAPQSWFHVSVYATPSETAGHAESTMTVQLSGDLKDGAGNAVSFVSEGGLALNYDNATADSASFQVLTTVPTDASNAKIPGGFYLDDTHFYVPGVLRATDVQTDSYDDPADNVNLHGTVKITYNHDFDLSSFDLSKVRLYTSVEESIPYTSVAFDVLNPKVLTFSFAQHPLSTYTTYYVSIEEAVCDVGQNAIYNPVVSFMTQGIEGSRPAPEPIIEAPAGGYVMPDEYNTGYRCDESELVPFTEKYPLFTSSNVIITEDLARAYDYEFSHFTLTGSIKVTATSPVYLHDFYFEGNSYYGITNSGSARLTVAWAECVRSLSTMFSGTNLTLSHVYCHDVSADHMKGDSNQVIESCYFRDGGTRTPGAHADVIQISCSTTKVTNSIKILGNRFDIPNLAHEHVANATVFLKPEKWNGDISQGVANLQVSHNWFNGGGYTTYLITNDTPVDRMNYLTYTYNQIGCGRMYGSLACNPWSTSDFNYSGNTEIGLLNAGSVVYYNGDGERVFAANELAGEGKILVNFANYTTVERSYKIVVDAVDASGNVVKTYVAQDSIFRYTPTKEYYVADNLADLLDENGNPVIAEGRVVQYLKELPVLPRNISGEVELTDLPDMSSHTLQVRIYDTTADEAFIRSSELAEDVFENSLLAGAIPQTHTVTFLGKDGQTLKVQTVEDGAAATAPTAPTVEGYTFTGWSADFSVVTADLTVKAQYSKNETPTPPPTPTPTPDPAIAEFESAVEALALLEDASLSAKYEALYAAALAFAQIEDKDTALASEAYADYLAFASAYNETARGIASDVPKPF